MKLKKQENIFRLSERTESAMKVFNFYQKHAVKTIPEFLIFIFETVGSDTTDSEKVRSEICRKTKLEMKHRLLENISGARVFEGKSITELTQLGFPADGVMALRCKTYFECTADGQNFRVHFRDFDQLNFGGRIQSGDPIKCICCFPGMYETEWRESADCCARCSRRCSASLLCWLPRQDSSKLGRTPTRTPATTPADS